MKQQEKLKALFISSSDWSLHSFLSTLFITLHDATVQLQSQKYPMVPHQKGLKNRQQVFTPRNPRTQILKQTNIVCTAIYEKIKFKPQKKVSAVNS